MQFISFKKSDYLYSSSSPNIDKFQMHLHRYYEFLYFIGGSGTYMVEDKEYTAEPGDIFITRPNELHAIVFDPGAKYQRKFIQISQSFLSDVEIDVLHFINSRPLGEYNRVDKDLVQKYHLDKYFTDVEYYILNRLPESDLMVKTYVIQFLVNLNAAFAEYDHRAVLKKRSNEKIDTIIEYINEHIADDISLETLSEIVFINKFHMCHIFKENVGLSIKEYINTRRIAKAKSLMATGEDFTSICFQCGFNDYSTFYKTFKKFTGTSPRKFLK